MNVVQVEEQTPERVATQITRETDLDWWVACEGGCGKTNMVVPKFAYRPVDHADESKGYIEIRATAPRRARCIECGPFRQAAIGASEIREGDVLIGDAICPNRYGAGITVQAVNNDLDGLVLVLAGGRPLEFIASGTVYVLR